MSTVVIMSYYARCKHCRFASTEQVTKKDGAPSKRRLTFCRHPSGPHSGQQIRRSDFACKTFAQDI